MWLFILQVDLLDFYIRLHWLTTIWLTVVMWPTQIAMTMLVCSCRCWCACQVAVLLSDGCPLGVSHLHLHMESNAESSMFIGFAWCCMCMLLHFLYFSMLDMFVCWQKHILTCSLVHSFKKKFLHVVRSFVDEHIFTCIVCSSIHEHILLHVLSLFIPFVAASCLFMYLYLQLLMKIKHHIHKPPSLPWCMVIDFGCRWSGERTRLRNYTRQVSSWDASFENY